MSLISTFVEAFKKAASKKPEVDMKTYGPMGSTTQSAAGSFTPLRPAPEPDTGHEVDAPGIAVAGEPAGGESAGPKVDAAALGATQTDGLTVETLPEEGGSGHDGQFDQVFEDDEGGSGVEPPGSPGTGTPGSEPAPGTALKDGLTVGTEGGASGRDGQLDQVFLEDSGSGAPGADTPGIPEGHVPGTGLGADMGRPEGHVPGTSPGADMGRPEGHVPGTGPGAGMGRPEGRVPGTSPGADMGRPEGHVPGSGADADIPGIPERHGAEGNPVLQGDGVSRDEAKVPAPDSTEGEGTRVPLEDLREQPRFEPGQSPRAEPGKQESATPPEEEEGTRYALEDHRPGAGTSLPPEAVPPGGADASDPGDSLEALARKAGGSQEPYFKVELKEAFVSSYSAPTGGESSGPGDEGPEESDGLVVIAHKAAGDVGTPGLTEALQPEKASLQDLHFTRAIDKASPMMDGGPASSTLVDLDSEAHAGTLTSGGVEDLDLPDLDADLDGDLDDVEV